MKIISLIFLTIPLLLKATTEENERIEDVPCWEFDITDTLSTDVGDLDSYTCTFYFRKFIDYKSFEVKITERKPDSKSIVSIFEDDKFLTILNSTTDVTQNYKLSVEAKDLTAKFECESTDPSFECDYDIETVLDWGLKPLGYFLLILLAIIILVGIGAIVLLILVCLKKIFCPGEEVEDLD